MTTATKKQSSVVATYDTHAQADAVSFALSAAIHSVLVGLPANDSQSVMFRATFAGSYSEKSYECKFERESNENLTFVPLRSGWTAPLVGFV